jgi:hypothetical protein
LVAAALLLPSFLLYSRDGRRFSRMARRWW